MIRLLLLVICSLLAGRVASEEQTEITSNYGALQLQISPAATHWPLYQPFDIAVTVTGVPVSNLTVTADMPGHGHGLIRPPEVLAGDSGNRFRVVGLRLHMAGDWQVFFDLRIGTITERAQLAISLP